MIVNWSTIRYGIPAIWRKIVCFILRKPLFVSPEIQRLRLNVCDDCKYSHGIQCLVCTCLLNAKTQFTDESCPKGKW